MAASNSGEKVLEPQAPTPVPTPVVVVSPQFCAPYVVPLTVKKKGIRITGGDFTVTDTYGAVMLQVKGIFPSVRPRRVLLDAAGQPILSMQREGKHTDRDRPSTSFFCFVFWSRSKSFSHAQGSKDSRNCEKLNVNLDIFLFFVIFVLKSCSLYMLILWNQFSLKFKVVSSSANVRTHKKCANLRNFSITLLHNISRYLACTTNEKCSEGTARARATCSSLPGDLRPCS